MASHPQKSAITLKFTVSVNQDNPHFFLQIWSGGPVGGGGYLILPSCIGFLLKITLYLFISGERWSNKDSPSARLTAQKPILPCPTDDAAKEGLHFNLWGRRQIGWLGSGKGKYFPLFFPLFPRLGGGVFCLGRLHAQTLNWNLYPQVDEVLLWSASGPLPIASSPNYRVNFHLAMVPDHLTFLFSFH